LFVENCKSLHWHLKWQWPHWADITTVEDWSIRQSYCAVCCSWARADTSYLCSGWSLFALAVLLAVVYCIVITVLIRCFVQIKFSTLFLLQGFLVSFFLVRSTFLEDLFVLSPHISTGSSW